MISHRIELPASGNSTQQTTIRSIVPINLVKGDTRAFSRIVMGELGSPVLIYLSNFRRVISKKKYVVRCR
jgi:hypothetical protein